MTGALAADAWLAAGEVEAGGVAAREAWASAAGAAGVGAGRAAAAVGAGLVEDGEGAGLGRVEGAWSERTAYCGLAQAVSAPAAAPRSNIRVNWGFMATPSLNLTTPPSW